MVVLGNNHDMYMSGICRDHLFQEMCKFQGFYVHLGLNMLTSTDFSANIRVVLKLRFKGYLYSTSSFFFVGKKI